MGIQGSADVGDNENNVGDVDCVDESRRMQMM